MPAAHVAQNVQGLAMTFARPDGGADELSKLLSRAVLWDA